MTNTQPRAYRRVIVGLVVLAAALATGAKAEPVKTTDADGITWTKGVPWTGRMGVTESVATIMKRAKGRKPLIARDEVDHGPDRSHLPQNPNSPAVSQWPPPARSTGPNAAPPSPSPQAPQTPGASCKGPTFNEIQAWPPDTMGAVGPQQFIVSVNGILRSYNKASCTPDGALNLDQNSFWESVAGGTGQTTDPRIRYDRLSQRWILVMIDVPALVEPTPPNSIMIAVSSGPVVTGTSSFTFFSFVQSLVVPPGTDSGCFADYETLGVDAKALYIGANMFCPLLYANSSVFVVKKSSILGAGPLVVTAFRDLLDAPTVGAGPFTPQGVDNYDPAANLGYIVGVDNASFGTIDILKIMDPGGTPSISSTIPIAVPTTAFPVDAPSKGGNNAEDSLEDRLQMGQIRGTKLWTVHNIEVNSSGVGISGGGRTGSRWYSFDISTAIPSLAQSGTLYDPAASNPKFYWMPSLNVSGQGHMAIGTSVSSVNDYIGAAAAGRLATDPGGSTQAPVTYQAGQAAYNPTNAGTAVTRWGDYSYTSVDPDDDMTMWTIQEYVDAPNSYSERMVKLIAPPPATPSSASPSNLPLGNPSIDVTIGGTTFAGSGFFDPGPGFLKRLGVTVSGGVTVNSVSYMNPTTIEINVSTVGTPAGVKTVTVTNPDGQSAAAAILGVGTGSGPAAGLNPTSLSFGNQLVGTTSPPHTVTVTSVGTASLVIGAVTKVGSSDFAISADSCSGQTLAIGSSCSISATFTPAAGGPSSGSILIASNAPTSPNAVPMSGAGVTPDVTPPSKVLGLAGVPGTESATLSWSPATDDTGVDHYIVYQDNVDVLHVPSTMATINGLTNGVNYTFAVAAVDAAGNTGAVSDPISVKPFAIWSQFHGDGQRTGSAGVHGSISVPHVLQTLTASDAINSSPLIADLNGDGKADVVAVGDPSTPASLITVRAYRQTSSGLVPYWTYAIPPGIPGGTPTNGLATLAIGDVTGDGIPDVVAYSNYVLNLGAGTINDGHVSVLRGTTGALEGEFTSTDITIGLASPPAIGDVTGDGVSNIVLLHQVGGTTPGYFLLGAHFDGPILVKDFDTNIGTTSFLASPVLAELRSVHPGLEIVVGQNTSTGQVLICRPIGSSAGCMEAVNAGVTVKGLAVQDLDGDGSPEIVANGSTGSSLKVMQTEPTFALKDSSSDGPLWTTPTLGDVTGDGNADILNVKNSADPTDTTKQGDLLLRSFAGGTITGKKQLTRAPAPGSSTMSPGGGVLADISGDGTPEYIFGSLDGKLVAVKFTAGTPSVLWSLSMSSNPVSPLAVADVTGDGLADLVVGTNTGSIAVIGAGPLDHITISPASSTITADQSQTYSVEGFDSVGNSLGDVTGTSTFTISPNGSCTGATCSATVVGAHTVTAHNGAKTASATLTVTPGALASIVLSPDSATIVAGTTQAYTVNGYDAYGNLIGDETASTTFSIGPDGTCSANACGSNTAGAHIVTGEVGAISDVATLSVTAGPTVSIALTPAVSTIVLGGVQTYVASGFDTYGNPTGDVTSGTTFSIAPDGSCTNGECTPATAGDHSVIGNYTGLLASATLHVLPSGFARIEISPSSSTVSAGTAQAYTVQAFDSSDVLIGDVTAQTVFSITPNGSCSGSSCSATTAGPHVVTGVAAGASDTSNLSVVAGPLHHLVLVPANATVTVGQARTYAANGADQYGNVIGDVTASTIFTIAPDGGCSGNQCTPAAVGSHTVTGVSGVASGTAQLKAIPVPPSISSPTGGFVPASVHFTGTGPPSSTISLHEGTLQLVAGIPVDAAGLWEVTLSMPSGQHTVVARATVGTFTSDPSAARTFTVDGDGPTVAIHYPQGYALAQVVSPIDEVEVRGIAKDAASGIDHVRITYADLFGGPSIVDDIACVGPCNQMSWVDHPALPPGVYAVSVVAVDRAGNISATAKMNIVNLSLVSGMRTPRHPNRPAD